MSGVVKIYNPATLQWEIVAPAVTEKVTSVNGMQGVVVIPNATDSAQYVGFDVTPTGVPDPQAGVLAWDTLDHTLALQLDLGGVVLQVGQEEHFVGYNNTGVDIADGVAVSIDGVQGDRARVLVTNFNDATSVRNYIGLATMIIPNGGVGIVTRSGLVRGIDTNSHNAEDRLWGTGLGLLTATEPASGYKVLVGMVVKKAGAGSGMIAVNGRSSIIDGSTKILHGVENAGVPTFDNTTHVITLPTNNGYIRYWHEGKMFYGTSALSTDFDTHVTLTANTQYYVTANDVTGALTVSPNAWTIAPNVFVATVFWNGTAGAVIKETHNHTRDRDWHRVTHSFIGAQISPADFSMTAPSLGSPSTINVVGGTIQDEDLATVHGTLTNCRVWYQVGASSFTFVDRSSIYPSIGVAFADSAAAYALTAVGVTSFINIWIYVSPDTVRGLYAFVETKAAVPYSTAALARAAVPPVRGGFGLTNEMKLLYRVIMRGDETFTEMTDYRATAAVPYGGSGTPTAAGVTFAPTSSILSTNVQNAIEEADHPDLDIIRANTFGGF